MASGRVLFAPAMSRTTVHGARDRWRVAGARALLAMLPLAALLPSASRADTQNGERIYRSWCVLCHTPAGIGGTIALRSGAGQPARIVQAIGFVPQMSFLRDELGTQDIADVADYLAVLFNVAPPAAKITVVEFHHAGLDHYFISANATEIAALDAGTTIRGWTRTGGTFNAWMSTGAAPSGASPVCRFYIPPARGDSHFYSASPAECDDVRARFPDLVPEAPEVMAVRLPDLASGECAADTVAVYRLWNMRADSNHRYTTRRDTRAQMLDRGYVSEGYGPDGVAFCAPL
jgi:mono/diheme cytochrome c family protein